MALSQCNVLTAGPPGQAIGEVQIDSTVSPGNDYYIVEHSLVGPAGPWLNPDQSGGINGGSTPFTVFEVRSGNPPGVPIWFRWRQFDNNDNFLDEEICQGLTVPLPPLPPGVVNSPVAFSYCGVSYPVGTPAIFVPQPGWQMTPTRGYWRPASTILDPNDLIP